MIWSTTVRNYLSKLCIITFNELKLFKINILIFFYHFSLVIEFLHCFSLYLCAYTLLFKRLGPIKIFVFEGWLLCSPRLHLFDQKYSKIVKYYCKNNTFLFEYLVKCNLFLLQKLNFQHHYSSLQCNMIFRKSF